MDIFADLISPCFFTCLSPYGTGRFPPRPWSATWYRGAKAGPLAWRDLRLARSQLPHQGLPGDAPHYEYSAVLARFPKLNDFSSCLKCRGMVNAEV